MAELQEDQSATNTSSKSGYVLLGIALVLAAVSVAYNVWGDKSSAQSEVQTADGPPSIEELRDAALASPDNSLAWQELGFAHFSEGQFADASDAYERAVEIDDSHAVLWSALGEARVMASERDPLPPAALEAFEQALSIDPTDPRARYFMAVKKDIDGDHAGAIDSWLGLLSDTPPGAPWEGDLVRTIEQVGRINDIDVSTRLATVIQGRAPSQTLGAPNLRGPTQEQVAAAGSLSADDQRQMAVGMVERLEERLAADPSNLDGWVMLMRSRMTLGEPERARAALDAAIAANPAAEPGLRAQAEQLGVR